MLGKYGLAARAEVHAPALAATEQALRLDPGLAEAHRTLALLRWQFDFDWTAAAAAYDRALALDPGSALVRQWRGVFFGVQGSFAESLAQLERARSLDPLSLNVIAITGWMHYFAGRHRDALPFYRHALEVDPEHLISRWFLGQALLELGDGEASRRELEKAVALSGRASRLLGYLGHACGRVGRHAEARAVLAELDARGGERYVPPYFSALVLIGLGESERSLDRLEQARAAGDSMLRDLKVDPAWQPLRREARYRRLLDTLRLAPSSSSPTGGADRS